MTVIVLGGEKATAMWYVAAAIEEKNTDCTVSSIEIVGNS